MAIEDAKAATCVGDCPRASSVETVRASIARELRMNRVGGLDAQRSSEELAGRLPPSGVMHVRRCQQKDVRTCFGHAPSRQLEPLGLAFERSSISSRDKIVDLERGVTLTLPVAERIGMTASACGLDRAPAPRPVYRATKTTSNRSSQRRS